MSLKEKSYKQQRVPYSKEAMKQALAQADEIDIYRDWRGKWDREWSFDRRTSQDNPASILKAVDHMITKAESPLSGAKFYIQYAMEEAVGDNRMKTIEVTKEVQIPGTDILLEVGDTIQVLDEMSPHHADLFLDGLKSAFQTAIGGIFTIQEGFNLGADLAMALSEFLQDKVLAQSVPRDTARDIREGFIANFKR